MNAKKLWYLSHEMAWEWGYIHHPLLICQLSLVTTSTTSSFHKWKVHVLSRACIHLKCIYTKCMWRALLTEFGAWSCNNHHVLTIRGFFHMHYSHLHLCLLCSPSHTSHILQPLDIGIFKSFQSWYAKACQKYVTDNPGRVITSGRKSVTGWQYLAIFHTQVNILSGFKKVECHHSIKVKYVI